MPSIAVRLDEDLQARLKKIADIDDRTPHYLMKKAIEAYVVSEERRIRELDILDTRWTTYEQTGDVVPVDTVWAWIDSLPDGEEADAAA